MTKPAKPQEQAIDEMPGDEFDASCAYHRWIEARAKFLDPHLPEEMYEEIADNELAAAQALAATPARVPEDVHNKIEALRYFINDAILKGRLNYPIEPFLISSIQNDLYVLGIGDGTK